MPRPLKRSPASRSPDKPILRRPVPESSPEYDIKPIRICYSCSTSVTPYWRDGWSPGIILCNACGLRFSKYRKVCHTCKWVGKKANYERITCPNCGTGLD